MSATSINTISEFLLHAGTEYRVFDMGRGIKSMSHQEFIDFENNITPASHPRNGSVWFGIVFWNKQLNHEHYIWFIKLPIDENGLLIAATRNQFLEIVVTALGNNLEHAQSRQAELPENPFVFQPPQQQMADFNALSKASLGIESKNGSDRVRQYLQAPSVQDWRGLSVQDISNFSVQLTQHTSEQRLLAKNLSLLSPQFLTSLCSSLENITVDKELCLALIKLARETNEPLAKSTLIRALCAQSEIEVQAFIDEQLESEAIPIEVLIVIAGRLWSVLYDKNRLQLFMQRTAQADNSFELFKGLYSDLVQLPVLRQALHALIRSPDKPNALTLAVGALFSNYKEQKL